MARQLIAASMTASSYPLSRTHVGRSVASRQLRNFGLDEVAVPIGGIIFSMTYRHCGNKPKQARSQRDTRCRPFHTFA